MTREPVNILWHNELNSVAWSVDTSDLQDLHVVSHHVGGQLEWTHIDDVHVFVLDGEDARQLWVLSLKELLHGDPLYLLDRHRIYVDLYTLMLFDSRPFLLELVHHLSPHEEWFIGQFFNALLGLFLEQVKSEVPLDSSGLAH